MSESKFVPAGKLEKAIVKQQNGKIIQLIVEGERLTRPDVLATEKFFRLPLRTAAVVARCAMSADLRREASESLKRNFPESEVISLLADVESVPQAEPTAEEDLLMDAILKEDEEEIHRLILEEHICLRNILKDNRLLTFCLAQLNLSPYTTVLLFSEGLHYASQPCLFMFLLMECGEARCLKTLNYKGRVMFANLLIHILQGELTPGDEKLIEEDWYPRGNSIKEGSDPRVPCHRYSYYFDPRHLYEPRRNEKIKSRNNPDKQQKELIMAETKMQKLEQERLFGEDIDLFKSYYAVKFLHNILKRIGLKEVKDNDLYRSLASYLTVGEVSAIYDAILPKKKRTELSESRHYRTPPELNNDDADDCLAYLGRNLDHRKKMWHKLEEVYAVREKEFAECLQKKDRKVSAVERRFLEMKDLFNLSQTEMEILLAIFFSTTRYLELGDYEPGHYQHSEKITSLAMVVGKLDVEVAELLNDKNNIGRFGLLDNECDMDRTFLSYLAGISSKALSERFWNKFEGEVLPWSFHGKLAEKHGAVLKRMIQAKSPENGISVLLFGVAGSGKTSFAASLAKDMGKELYFIAQNDDDNRRMSYSPAFRYAALAVAQKQLDPEKCILVVDECDKMVENCSLGGGFLSFLGIEPVGSRDGEAKGQLNTVIDQNRHTVLWICNSKQNAIDPSSRRRFDYSIFFDELSSGTRKYIWENALKFYHCEGKLTDEFIRCVSSRYPVNPGGISVAVKNAALLCRHDDKVDFPREVMTFLKAHCSLLGIQESPDDKLEPARDYSLEGLNIRSGIKLPRLIDACRKFLGNLDENSDLRDQPRMNLLLFGVPGAGKTEFVKYLAKQLDKSLCIKNASDLLNMYVGGTEQRIAAAFAEAESNGEILFIDEGDSLFGSREGASKSWEVSQVNTLLSEMERFRGIFIVGTNLIQRLDQAALRRFSFRLHFDYLTNEGKEIFYRTYFKPLNMPELTDEEKKALHDIEQMTPSDFRNTRQQFFYLEDSCLTNAEIIEALAAEVASKTSGSNYTGLGKIANRMGF